MKITKGKIKNEKINNENNLTKLQKTEKEQEQKGND